MIPLTYKGSLFIRSSPLSGFVEHKASDFLDFMDPDEYSVKRCTNYGELTLWRRRRLVYPQNSGITPVDCMPDHAKEPFTEAQSIATVPPSFLISPIDSR